MADVFLAVATGPAGLGFSKLVVIKRVREPYSHDPEFVSMLVDEARIAARLNHPNVVQTIEIGEEHGEYFLAMEYLEGQSLRRILDQAHKSGGFPDSLHYAVLTDVLAGLHHAHELHNYDGTPLLIVHRDVTPDNVFVTYEGQVKIVDFGIAKAVGRSSMTRHGVIKGKAPYIAPEQAQTAPVDRRADIYSVGVMLWEAATRKRMWAHAIDDKEIIRALIRGKIPASPRLVNSDVPDAIDAICRRALAFKPEDRYASAAELQAELMRFSEQELDRASDRELGAFVSGLFVKTRRRTKAIIGSQLARVLVPNSTLRVQFPPPSFTSSPEISVGVLPKAAETTESSLDASGPSIHAGKLGQAEARQEGPRRARMLSIAAIGIVALGFLVWISIGRRRAGDQATVATAGEVSARPAVPSPSASSETALVKLTMRASPSDARFSIDYGPPLPNPYVGQRAKDDLEHQIIVTAPGYTKLQRTVRFDEDVALQLSLAVEPNDAGAPRRR